MKSRITNLLPEDKREKCPNFDPAECKKTFSISEIGKGSVIKLPFKAQIGRRQFLRYPQPAAVWSYIQGVSSATVYVCPPEWYVGIEVVERNSGGFEADEMAHRCCNKWLMPMYYDGDIELLAPTVAEYLASVEGSSHAAA